MGSVVPDQTVELVVDTPSLAVVDGKFGYGQTVTPQAVKIGIEKCKKAGLSADRAAQRRAYRPRRRLGRNGCRRGLVSVHFVNAAGSLLVAPFGGAETARPRPMRRHSAPGNPIVLDFATSIVAEAGAGGEPRRQEIAHGALVDADGTLSEDPAVLYGPYTPGRTARPHQRHWCDPCFRRTQGLGLASSANCSAAR
jgi:uncharacterized oxidoreductase